LKYRGSATGGFAGMSSYTLESFDMATAMVEVSVPPAFTLVGDRERAYRWGPAVAQISVSHVNNCETFAAMIYDVKDAVDGETSGLFTNSYYAPAMRRVSFGVVTFPQNPAPAWSPGPPHCHCTALANVLRFTEDSEVTQKVPPPPPPIPFGGI
jgi:hypothetical protein